MPLPPPSSPNIRLSTDDAGASRRATKACSTCHARKTRCDVLKSGVPCTKCKDSGFQCSIEPRKKRRSRLRPGDSGGAGSVIPTPRVVFPEHIMRHQIPHYAFFRNFAPPGKPSLHAGDRERGLILPIVPHDQSADNQNRDARAEDMRFLKQKGAFDLPPKAILDDCVSAYFRFFHPFFPVVDRPSFLAKYHSSDANALSRGQGPSLLLLQAIIFTASAVSTAFTR